MVEAASKTIGSRWFEWGLITDVQPPDLVTRIAILRKKAQMERLTVPDEVLELIASSIQRNIRELEGALIRVTAFASLNKTPIDKALAEIVLRDLIADATTMQISAATIMAATVRPGRWPSRDRSPCTYPASSPSCHFPGSGRLSVVTTPPSCTPNAKSCPRWPSDARCSITSKNSPLASVNAPVVVIEATVQRGDQVQALGFHPPAVQIGQSAWVALTGDQGLDHVARRQCVQFRGHRRHLDRRVLEQLLQPLPVAGAFRIRSSRSRV